MKGGEESEEGVDWKGAGRREEDELARFGGGLEQECEEGRRTISEIEKHRLRSLRGSCHLYESPGRREKEATSLDTSSCSRPSFRPGRPLPFPSVRFSSGRAQIGLDNVRA